MAFIQEQGSRNISEEKFKIETWQKGLGQRRTWLFFAEKISEQNYCFCVEKYYLSRKGGLGLGFGYGLGWSGLRW